MQEMKLLESYLRRRLAINISNAKDLVPTVIEGARSYLSWLYNYDKLERIDIDESDLIMRLERPFPFGFFVKQVLDSNYIETSLKERVALESWLCINLNEDEGVPAYLAKALNFLRGSSSGLKREHFEFIVNSVLLLDEHSIGEMSDEIKDIEELFDHFMTNRKLSSQDKVAYLTAMLSLSHTNSTTKIRLYERFLGNESIELIARREFAERAVSDTFIEDTKVWVRKYTGENGKNEGERNNNNKEPSSIFDYFSIYKMPSLQRKSIVWLAKYQDPKLLVDKYFKERTKEGSDTYRTLGALDICFLNYDRLGREFSSSIIRRALQSNRKEVRSTAERYLKSL